MLPPTLAELTNLSPLKDNKPQKPSLEGRKATLRTELRKSVPTLLTKMQLPPLIIQLGRSEVVTGVALFGLFVALSATMQFAAPNLVGMVATELVELGVPKEKIRLAFLPPGTQTFSELSISNKQLEPI